MIRMSFHLIWRNRNYSYGCQHFAAELEAEIASLLLEQIMERERNQAYAAQVWPEND